MIGWLERFLVLTFVLAGSHAAIGLVLAAKDQKVAEYVLIGTMLSRSWAVLVGSLVLWLG